MNQRHIFSASLLAFTILCLVLMPSNLVFGQGETTTTLVVTVTETSTSTLVIPTTSYVVTLVTVSIPTTSYLTTLGNTTWFTMSSTTTQISTSTLVLPTLVTRTNTTTVTETVNTTSTIPYTEHAWLTYDTLQLLALFFAAIATIWLIVQMAKARRKATQPRNGAT